MPSAPRARKWGSAHGCGKPVRCPRMPRTVSSAATPRAISVYDALQLFGTRVHEPRPPCAGEHAAVKADQCDPLGPPAGPAKSRERLFASAQVDDGSARRRVELLLQHTHATNGEEPFARKSTRGKRPIVSRRVRTVQTVLGPSDAAASGLPSDPRGASVVERLGVAVRLARVGQIGQDLSCHQPEGSHADAEREGREVRLRPTHRPRPRVTVAKHGRPVVVVLSVEEYERLKALDTPETRPKKEEGE